MFGVEEVLLISVVVLVVFGPDKLPEVAKMLGKAAKEFRKVTYTAQRTWDEIGREMDLQEAQAKARQLEEKQRGEAGSRTSEKMSATSGDLPQVNSMPALENQESGSGGGQGEAPVAGCPPENITSNPEEQIQTKQSEV